MWSQWLKLCHKEKNNQKLLGSQRLKKNKNGVCLFCSNSNNGNWLVGADHWLLHKNSINNNTSYVLELKVVPLKAIKICITAFTTSNEPTKREVVATTNTLTLWDSHIEVLPALGFLLKSGFLAHEAKNRLGTIVLECWGHNFFSFFKPFWWFSLVRMKKKKAISRSIF